MSLRYLSLSLILAMNTAQASELTGTNPDLSYGYRLIQLPDGTVKREIAPQQKNGQQKYIIELQSKAVLPRLQSNKTGKGLSQLAAPLLLQAENQVKYEQQQLTAELLQDHLISDSYASTHLLLNSLIVTANPADIGKIAALPNVRKVHADRELRLYRDRSIPLIQADKTWALKDNNGTALSGKGIRVGVLDSGIDYTHPDLGGCFGEGCKVAGGYDFYHNDADPIDTDGHGTHVAGIIAGNGTVKGVAPEATLYAYQVCNYYCPSSYVIQALERSADPDQNPLTHDALDVVNLSLGGPGSSEDPLTIASNNASKAGIVVVVAAGNDGEAYDALGSPGNTELAITVAASDFDDNIADFSSRGPGDRDLVLKPDLAAPGNNISSTLPNGLFGEQSGTSMAAPHVAGAAALLKQQNNSRTPEDIKSLLVNNSKALDAPFFAAGSGRLDVLAAAQNNVIFSPSALSFGKLNPEQPVWTSTRQIKLHNKGQHNEVLQLSVSDLPAGVRVQILANNQPQSQMSIAAGASIELSLQLSVDSAVYQVPTHAVLDDFALVVQNQQQLQQRVAMAFFAYNQLQIESPQYINRLQIYNQKGERKFDSYLDSQNKIRLAKAESYDFIAEYDGYDQMQLVVLENQQLANNGSIRISPELAVHKLEVTAVTDPNGAVIPKETLVGGLNSVEIRHAAKPVFYNKLFGVFGQSVFGSQAGLTLFNGKTLWLSPFSSQYQLAAFASWQQQDTPADKTEIYSWNTRLQGINSSQQVTLNAATMHRFQTYIEPDNKRRFLSFGYRNEKALGAADFAASDTYGEIGLGAKILELAAKQAHTATIYGQSLSIEPQFGTGIFHLQVVNADFVWEDSATGGRRFWGEQGTAEVELEIDSEPPYARKLAAKRIDNSAQHQLSLYHDWMSAISYFRGDKYWLSMQRENIYQSRYNQSYSDESEHVSTAQLRCDLKPGATITTKAYNYFFEASCDRADIEVKHLTALADMFQPSFTKVTMLSNNNNYEPVMRRLQFGTDKQLGQYLSQGLGFVEIVIAATYSPNAEIHYQGKWHPLELQATASSTTGSATYRAEFSLPATAALASFRFQLEDNAGNKTEHLLQNAVIVGPKPEDALLADNDKDSLPDVTDQDDDNDGLSDIDELRYHLDIYQDDKDADTDKDGLTNQQEFAANTFADQADSDQDNMPDGYEAQTDLDPLDKQDGLIDPDQDSLTNAAEYQHKTDPKKADTDGDGMPDGYEVQYSLNPLDAADATSDKDQDGSTALQEFKAGTNPTVSDKKSGGGSSGGNSSGGGASSNEGGGDGGSMGLSVLSLAAIWCYRRQYRLQGKKQQSHTQQSKTLF